MGTHKHRLAHTHIHTNHKINAILNVISIFKPYSNILHQFLILEQKVFKNTQQTYILDPFLKIPRVILFPVELELSNFLQRQQNDLMFPSSLNIHLEVP